MRPDQDDTHPTLFPLPPPSYGSEVPRRPAVMPHAPNHVYSRRALRQSILADLKARTAERWKAFCEWSGFAKREIEVEIIPGRKCRVAIPQDKPPKLLLFRLLPDKKANTWFTRPVTLWGNLARFDSTLCEDLGLPIGRTTLWRLIYAGFVKAYRIAPMTTLVDLESLMQHMHNTQLDGESSLFWNNDRVTRYREWEKLTPAMLARLEAESAGSEEEDAEEGEEGN